MHSHISILRGINVSGHKKILMADLAALYQSLKLKDVLTYIQSGNVLFNYSGKATDEELIKKIEKAIKAKYAFDVPVIVRRREEIEKVIALNPFLKRKDTDLEKLHVTFLATAPDKEKLENLKTINYPPDEFELIGKDVYLYCPHNYGETKLTNNLFEKKLGVTATTRNWKTVNKLLQLASS